MQQKSNQNNIASGLNLLPKNCNRKVLKESKLRSKSFHTTISQISIFEFWQKLSGLKNISFRDYSQQKIRDESLHAMNNLGF